MIYPTLNTKSAASVQTIEFAGLNRRDCGSEGEFSDIKNLTGAQYPCLKTRGGRAQAFGMTDIHGGAIENIRAIIAPKYTDGPISAFTGVAGGAFYYNGKKIPFENGDMSLGKEESICLADFNGTIIICPQMYYFSYVPEEDTHVRNMKKGFYGISARVYSSGDPDEDAEVTNRINADADWGELFKEGDCVFLEGFEGNLKANNTLNIDSKFSSADDTRPLSVVVQKIDGKNLYLQMANRKGRLMVFKDGKNTLSGNSVTLNIYIPIPKMNWVCVHNNRLWGTNPNGEQIYASKLGDPFNFNTFFGLSTDSWYSEIGTKGGFVGLVSFRDSVVAFKRDFIHHVYGDKPANYNIPKQLADCGCTDIKSVAEIGGTLYFLGPRGFYSYSGASVSLISEKLNMTYSSACAMTDGKDYYVHAMQTGGTAEFLKYDAQRGVWYTEDDIELVGYVKHGGRLYAAEKDKVLLLDEDGEQVSWHAQTVRITENTMMTKGIYDIFLRLDMEAGSEAEVYIVRDNGEKRLCGAIKDSAFRTHRVPVRFQQGDSSQIRIEGKGRCTIHGIERVVYAGGKRYR